jgi:SAM-dependent methyltransferase
MTPAMVARARSAAKRLELHHVEFREGLIERLPIEDAVADAVISNCVLNLAADIPIVLAEALRVLRPGRAATDQRHVSRRRDDARCARTSRLVRLRRRRPRPRDPRRAGAGGRLRRRRGSTRPGHRRARARPTGRCSAASSPTSPRSTPPPPPVARACSRRLDCPRPVGMPPGFVAGTLLTDGRLVGVVALEVHGRFGLLRSVGGGGRRTRPRPRLRAPRPRPRCRSGARPPRRGRPHHDDPRSPAGSRLARAPSVGAAAGTARVRRAPGCLSGERPRLLHGGRAS